MAKPHDPWAFAETKEQLGGYYLLDCKNLDEAIEWAARCPGARVGSIGCVRSWSSNRLNSSTQYNGS
jgi:hypothetical protein